MPPLHFLWDYNRKQTGSRRWCQISGSALLSVWGLVLAQLGPHRSGFSTDSCCRQEETATDGLHQRKNPPSSFI